LTLQASGQLASIGQQGVIELTGPAIWTDVIFDYFNDPRFFKTEESRELIDYKAFTGMETRKRVGDVAVLPITSFSPGVGQMGSKEDDDEMAFVKHYFEGSLR
jgi:alpha 1,6-mannosyltransferase